MILLLVTCTSCKAIEPYFTVEYLNALVSKAGLGDGNNSNESLSQLISWGVINKDEEINEYLNYGFLASTINNLIENEDKSIDSLKDKGWIKKNKKDSDLVEKDEALEVIDKAVNEIDNKVFNSKYEITEKQEVDYLDEYTYKDDYLSTNKTYSIGDYIFLENDGVYKKIVGYYNGQYKLKDVEFEEIIEELHVEDTYSLDLSEAIDTPGEVSLEYEDNSLMYVNNGKNLLASKKTKSFNSNGFRVSYKLTSSGIDARISRDVKGVNAFFDISINNIKPSYKWDYKNGKVNDAYFKVDFNSTEEIGVSIGRYKNYYLDFKDKDSSSFMNLAKSVIKTKDDEVEATIKICEIKTPVPGVPTLFFNIDVLAKVYLSGKVEIVLTNSHTKGFEIKEGQFRFINDNQRDIDLKIGASGKVALGLNFNLEAITFRLMDIELDAGIKASVKTTVHLYDSDDNKASQDSDLSYFALDEISKENNDVKVCGDLSLNWLLTVRVNTSKSLLYKFGLWKEYEILDEDNQVLGNLTHIENFVFVKKCTRKDRLKTNKNTSTELNIDKILLEKYSKVIKLNEEYQIPIKGIPDGYNASDLIYTSNDIAVATVDNNGTVKGKSKGATEIKISTSDDKYSASINILVSSN